MLRSRRSTAPSTLVRLLRAMAAAAASDVRDRSRLEREAARLHSEAQVAEVERLNAELAHAFEEIDGILAATLAVDDHLDLEAL